MCRHHFSSLNLGVTGSALNSAWVFGREDKLVAGNSNAPNVMCLQFRLSLAANDFSA